MNNSEEVLKKIEQIPNFNHEVIENVITQELQEAVINKGKEEFLKSIINLEDEEDLYSMESKEKLINYYMSNVPYMGYCHLLWGIKKKILKEKYNIDWYTPQEENPDVIYD